MSALDDKRRHTGIRTPDDLKARCWVDEDTGCWHWRGAVDSQGRPSSWAPALRRTASMGVLACLLRTGAGPLPKQYWHCTCITQYCANPEHRVCGTRKSQMLAQRLKRDPLVVARISRTKRLASKLSEADCEHIRTGGLKLAEIMDLYGISQGYACVVRSGQRRQPLAAPGSSVFAPNAFRKAA